MFFGLVIVSLQIFVYGALAVKLGRWSITMPMIFVTAGLLLGPGGLQRRASRCPNCRNY